MSYVSSPSEYSPASGPNDASPRKRRKLKPVDLNVAANAQPNTLAGFILDDSDEEDNGYERNSTSLQPCSTSTIQRFDSQGGIKLVVPGALSDANNDSKLLNHDVPPTDSKMTTSKTASHTDSIDALDQFDPYHERPKPFRKNDSTSNVARSSSGYVLPVTRRQRRQCTPFQQTSANRTNPKSNGVGPKSYYGVDVHRLVEEALEAISQSKLRTTVASPVKETLSYETAVICPRTRETSRSIMWTEKYRAQKFTDLVGDERTHRAVLRWLKSWDSIVFPGAARLKDRHRSLHEGQSLESHHKKLLLISGPPGLGKTTLAHVCARQAGYEVQEINASDDRNRDVVKGKIRDMVGTETIKKVRETSIGATKKSARPVCVIVDEVDGVVGGTSEGGDGGFIKALLDLLALDQRGTTFGGPRPNAHGLLNKKQRDTFRLLRPLILICNDLYHPSLRPLRQGNMAEIIFARRPSLNLIIPRVQHIFETEGFSCDGDGIRRLCEATWGIGGREGNKAGSGSCEGDFRSILVVGEWVASKLRAENSHGASENRLTKRWIEQCVLRDLADGGECARSLGRGGSRQLADRIFAYNAGFPSVMPVSHNVSERHESSSSDNTGGGAMGRLREMIAGNGEEDRTLNDCFAIYLSLPYQDDTFLSKPGRLYDWLHFYDQISSRVLGLQQWDLAAHLPTALLAFHALFASSSPHSYSNASNSSLGPEDSKTDDDGIFTGLRASYVVSETKKANRATLQHLQGGLSLPLSRAFGSPEDLAVELIPYVLRMLSPNVKPVVVGGSEKAVASVRRAEEKEMVSNAVAAMVACGVRFEKGKVEKGDHTLGRDYTGWVYRMEPRIDDLAVFETAEKVTDSSKTRYAVRQVLEQAWKMEVARRDHDTRARRMRSLGAVDEEWNERALQLPGETRKINATDKKIDVKRSNAATKDFFGRPINSASISQETGHSSADVRSSAASPKCEDNDGEGTRSRPVHEGRPRKGTTMKELLEGL